MHRNSAMRLTPRLRSAFRSAQTIWGVICSRAACSVCASRLRSRVAHHYSRRLSHRLPASFAAISVELLSARSTWLLLVRALLPLDVPAEQSAWVTFLLLALLGWAPAARVIAESTRALRDSAFVWHARTQGAGTGAVLFRHVLPNIGALVRAQFLILLPGFILAEATLGFLGLGVSEPVPSWGGMLHDLEDYSAIAQQPWRLAPLALLVLTVICLERLAASEPA
jgi:ABC-type dipeptide/oligopeptide/nickel transport system permease subunit